jgi:hypothetical protein
MNRMLETAVLTPRSTPGQKSPPNLRLIGTEDAARLAMCNPDEADSATDSGLRSWRDRTATGFEHLWPTGLVIVVAVLLAWAIG